MLDFHLARGELYRCVAQRWLKGLSPLLVVVEGRSVTLYEEIHPQKLLGNAKVHRRFLQRLAEILPAGSQPMVMTDAGFHAPWFKAVMAQGWQFVGRVRGRSRVRLGDAGAYLALFVQRLIGECAKQQQLELQFMATRRASRREISVITLDRRILHAAPHHLRHLLPWNAIQSLSDQAAHACGSAM